MGGMTHFLLTLLALPFSADCHALGDTDYRTRAAAHRRLADAGVWAAPALLVVTPPNLEAESRTEELWRGVVTWPRRLAPNVATDETADPAVIARRWPGLAKWMCHAIDLDGGFEQTHDSWEWVCRTPYRTGSLEGDFSLVVTTYRIGRRAASETPVGK